MAYQALYRKYRPRTFSDVIGQEHITETLKNELSGGKTVHAYLFTGTRGTGKTSCAKILANAVNCLDSKSGDPCLECESCKAILEGDNTDIVEIDAASNNGVDNIRELRELINFTPASSKYRVYIIDEVHMLSSGAFNALLKTLEEPPEHAIFILATTEVHKLPATILSRCQRFDFRRIDNEKICERIQFIAEKENLTVTDDAATLIAAAADGGMRDALSILDLCASNSKDINEAVVETVCAMAGNEYLLEMSEAIRNRDTEQALLLIDSLHNSSVDMQRLLSGLTEHYRDLMIVKTIKGNKLPIVCSAKKLEMLKVQANEHTIKDIMYCLSVLQASSPAMQTGNRRCEMEMAVIKMCNPELSVDIASLEKRISLLEAGAQSRPKSVSAVKPKEEVIKQSVSEIKAEEPEEIPSPITEYEPPAELQIQEKEEISESDDGQVERWEDILSLVRAENPLICGVLAGSKAYIKGEYLLIDAPNSQFRSLINTGDGRHKDSIRKAAEKVLGRVYKLGPYSKAETISDTDPLTALAAKLKTLEIN